MFYDSRELPDNTVITADICIIGAGAAGITLAREFIGTGVSVCLLESGGLEFDFETQSLYQGAMPGYNNYPLDASRLRFFGGTTNHWNGNIWPMFPDDFQQRDWIPDSGWPIVRSDLDAYYPKAAKVVELKGPDKWEPDQMKEYLQGIFFDPRLLDNKKLDRCLFQHSPPTRFGTTYRKELEEADTVHTYLYANAVGFNAGKGAESVTSVPVKCLNGKKHTVKARYYVLAAGAIESARLLLASSDQEPAGLGNQNDLVGRYFGDHPMARIGKIVFTDVEGGLAVPKAGQKLGIRGLLTLSTDALSEYKLPRFVGMLSPISGSTSKQAVKRFVDSSKRAWAEDEDFSVKLGEVASAFGEMSDELWQIHGWSDIEGAYLDVVVEQLPCPDSRVTLDTEVDALGLRRAKLDWRFLPEQEQATKAAFQLMAEQIGASGLGRMQITEKFNFKKIEAFLFQSSFHHLGTTRMSNDPATGVVDANCRMHSVSNLYVAGSAVFPTTGVTNPTLTIVALTLKLADHLKSALTGATVLS